MRFLAASKGVVDLLIFQSQEKEKRYIKSFTKRLLANIVYSHEAFDVEFFAGGKRITLTKKMLSSKPVSLNCSTLPALPSWKCEFSFEKKESGSLFMSYKLDNSILFFPFGLWNMFISILMCGGIYSTPNKTLFIITGFSFFFLFSSMLFVLFAKIIPHIILKKKINNIIHEV